MSFTTPVDGTPAIAEHVAQLTETLSGTRAIPVSVQTLSVATKPVVLSPDAGNTLQWKANGLFVPTPSAGVALPLTQNLTFSPDATYSIGAGPATSRPSNIYASAGVFAAGAQFTGNVTSAGVTTAGLLFTGAARITGDFSHATASSRVLVQTNVANGSTAFGIMNNGTGDIASLQLYGSSTPDNSSVLQLYAFGSGNHVIEATKIGSGAYKALQFNVNNTPLLTLNLDQSMTVPNGGRFVCRSGYGQVAGFAAVLLNANAEFNGTDWVRILDGSAAASLSVGPTSLIYLTAPAASGAPPWTTVFNVDQAGNTYINGLLQLPQGIPIRWTDLNSQMFSSSRTTYFDEYNGGWRWRNSSAGLGVCVTVTGAGQIGIHGASGAIAGAWSLGSSTGTTASSGGAGAPPGAVGGYWHCHHPNGTLVKIPYYL